MCAINKNIPIAVCDRFADIYNLAMANGGNPLGASPGNGRRGAEEEQA